MRRPLRHYAPAVTDFFDVLRRSPLSASQAPVCRLGRYQAEPSKAVVPELQPSGLLQVDVEESLAEY